MTTLRATAALFVLLIAGLSSAAVAEGAQTLPAGQPATATAGRQGTGGGSPAAMQQAEVDRLLLWLRARLAQQPIGPDAFSIRMSSSQIAWVSILGLTSAQTALLVPGVGGTSLVVRLYIPSTGLDELFTLFVPSSPPGVPRPLLACFHVYGSSHLDIAVRTDYILEARTRDWFMIAPLQHGGQGLASVSFGSVPSQVHVEAVVQLMLDNYSIDRDRIYGVGFSMGGGNALSYAARHRDRRTGAFAAVVNHTGTVALADVYQAVSPSVRAEMETLFSGTPTRSPFEWARSSSIRLDPSGALVPGADHMAINLSRMPIRTIYGTTDTMTYLINQSTRLDDFFQTVPGSLHELSPQVVPSTPSCVVNGHCWDTADEVQVCNWLATHSLDRSPASGHILADRAGRWGQFDVAPQASNDFARLDFALDAAMNRATITNVRNLNSVSFDLDDLGLDKTTQFAVDVETSEPNGDAYSLREIPSAPLIVLRNGILLQQSCAGGPTAASWCYSASTRELVLFEPGGPGVASWTVLP